MQQDAVGRNRTSAQRDGSAHAAGRTRVVGTGGIPGQVILSISPDEEDIADRAEEGGRGRGGERDGGE